MHKIDLQTWRRRTHFNTFNAFDHPHFNMCANVDLSVFYPYLKQRHISFTIAVVYLVTRLANAIPEFRYRIRDDEVVEHDVVHPSTTILAPGDLFTFCTIEYTEDFSLFAERAAQRIAYVKQHPTLQNVPGRDDMLYMTAIPWVSFTSFTHPIHLNPPDSIPRFAWGKIFQEGARLKMPLSVQGHHALMDGIHMAHFYAKMEDYLQQPASALGAG